ncbi:MAG: T9SS type A sorting domain-containing protein [Candidatus Cloacimonetes bacterium]|jgi:predicted extracellular nuclease|nr:T9SS type A sorting domain-containing protein [Candidatus Cloacimonadota bacterium]MBT6994025.1 T9SS type A sorting domain-containing protein [Candidatus Cloacimonadota bacterium]MBT7469612.1 T9SS type A sorting domain-containing protein [Candidatus Cloacimonadota bacterium]
MKRNLVIFVLGLMVVGLSATTIYDIQFTTNAGDGTYPSPMNDEDVTVTGIVTGNSSQGFYMSDPEGGAWHGIYVYSYDYNPSVGDEVEVFGTITEYYGLTEIGYATMTLISSDNQVPVPLSVTTEELVDGADAEGFEGCLVELNAVVVTQEADEHGQWYVTDTSGVPCQIDDSMFSYEATLYEEIDFIIGIVDYSYDEYGVNPRSATDIGAEIEPPPLVNIFDVQYTQNAGEDGTYPSDYDGENVTVEGIVTATGFVGERYFISDPDGGAWNGLYIYDSVNTPAVGDEVEIMGKISEYYGLTELTDVFGFEILSVGNTLPNAVEISTLSLSNSEEYEGVLVKIIDATVAAIQDENGQWFVNDGSGQCQVDDGFFYLDDEGIVLNIGDVWSSITGVVDYSYAEYGLHPRSTDDMVAAGGSADENQIDVVGLNNYPNPFNAKTTISFSMSENTNASIEIFNLKGQLIEQFNLNSNQNSVTWNAENQASGVYLYKMKSNGRYTSTKKMILLK